MSRNLLEDGLRKGKPDLLSLIGRLPKPIRRIAQISITSGSIGLFLAACQEDNSPPDGGSQPNVPKPESLVYQLPVYSEDIAEPWYLTGGPHSDGLSSGVRYAVDFASREVRPCPGSEIDLEHFAAASEDGEVILPSEDEEKNRKNHSVVEIRHADGTITGYMHLANIQVDLGQRVEQGDILGNLSCESPPGGKSEGQHVHFYRKGADGKPIPIAGMYLSGWQIAELSRNYDGTMSSPGEEVRTADRRRCGPDADSIISCGGIRNDLVIGRVLGTTVGSPIPSLTPGATETEAVKCYSFATVGCPAPDLDLKLSDGQMVKLSDYKGRPTVFFLHGFGCGSCVFELDSLLNLKTQYPELQILTIHDGSVQKLTEKTNPVFFWDYTSGPDSLDGKYRPSGLPSAYYIDRDWIVQRIEFGWRSVGKARERDISDLVAGRPLFRPPQFESREPFSFPRPSSGIYDIQKLGGMAVIAFKFDQQKLDPLLSLMLPEIPGPEEDHITEIIDKLTQAGRIVADSYCTDGDQIVFEFMRQLANYTNSKAADYAYEGFLDPTTYINLADAFNPACPITHFPTD